MPVKGADKVAANLQRIPARVRAELQQAVSDGAALVLRDMEALTPLDPSNPGPHARQGLTVIEDKGGLRAHIGLPTPELASDYFWFRFLDGGTKGGEVDFRRAGSGKRYTMQVPARPALNIRQRALDGNLDEIERLVRRAVVVGIGGSR